MPSARSAFHVLRTRIHLSALTAFALTAFMQPLAVAYADVGPPSICGFAMHREYLEGRHCVPDAFHLEKSDAGDIVALADDRSGRSAAIDTGYGIVPLALGGVGTLVSALRRRTKRGAA